MTDKKFFLGQMAILEAAYRNFKISDNKATLEVWYQSLKDIDETGLTKAVGTLIATSKFPPTIADIKEAAVEENSMDWSDGWALVTKAIRDYGIYRAEEALRYLIDLDYTTYAVVLRLDFNKLCLSENEMADRANFRMAYENVSASNNKNKLLPKGLQNPTDDMVAILTGTFDLNKKLENKKELKAGVSD